MLENTCESRKEYLLPQSSFIKELNSGGTAAVPGVTYTNVQGALEQVVVPHRNGTLDTPNASDVRVNDGCAIDLSDHISLVASKRMGQLLLNALDPVNTAPPTCAPNPPLLTDLRQPLNSAVRYAPSSERLPDGVRPQDVSRPQNAPDLRRRAGYAHARYDPSGPAGPALR